MYKIVRIIETVACVESGCDINWEVRSSLKTAFSLLSATQYDRTALDGLTPLTFALNTPKGPDPVGGIVGEICSSKIGACYLPCVWNP